MDIAVHDEGEVLVLVPAGRLDSGSAAAFEEVLLGPIDAGRTRLVIDLGDLEYISSAGLRVLLMAAKRLRQADGRLALCAVRDHIVDVFEISGFLSIFTVTAGRDEALATVAS